MNDTKADYAVRDYARFTNRNPNVYAAMKIGQGHAEVKLRGTTRYGNRLRAADPREVGKLSIGHDHAGKRIGNVAAAHRTKLIDAVAGAGEAADLGVSFTHDWLVLSRERYG